MADTVVGATPDSHASGDDPNRRDFSKQFHDEFLGEDIGHGGLKHKHEPDWTWKRPGLAMEMARDVYAGMVDLCKQQRGEACKARPFDDPEVQKRLTGFFANEPKLYVDRFRDLVDVPDVIDYSAKVRMLDPTYEIDPVEAAKRGDRVRRAKEREAAAARERRERADRRLDRQ